MIFETYHVFHYTRETKLKLDFRDLVNARLADAIHGYTSYPLCDVIQKSWTD